MRRKILSILSLAVLLFTGCQKEDTAPTIDSSYPIDGVVRIATSVNALQTRNTAEKYVGTNLSLSVDYGAGETYTQENIQWTQSNNIWAPASTESNEVMVWKDATTETKIYAYAPYVAGQNSMITVQFSAEVDQSVSLISSDLVGYVNASFTPSTDLVDGAIPIELSHKMSLLNINLTFGTEFDGTSTVVKSVSVQAQTAVTYNAKEAIAIVATGAQAVAITPNKIANATYSVIIAPQTIANSTKLVTVVMEDNTSYSYTVAVAEGHEFTSNTSNTITLRIGKDKIVLADNIEVSGWNNGSTIEGGEASSDSGNTVSNEAATDNTTNTLGETLIEKYGVGFNPADIELITVKGTVNQADFSSLQEFPNIDMSEATITGVVTINDPDVTGGVLKTVNGNAIPSSAFVDCVNLKTFKFPKNITAIGAGAFANSEMDELYALSGELIIPETVTYIGTMAFMMCSGLTKLKLPSNIEICNQAFLFCIGIKETLTIGKDTKIGAGAFSGCSGLEELVLDNELTSIGSEAFSGCSGFQGTLTIPASITAIGISVFEGCSGFDELIMHDKVLTIDALAFSGCSGFTETLILPKTLTTIDYAAFKGCSGFTGTLILPKTLTTIDYESFLGCNGLESIEAQWLTEADIPQIPADAFPADFLSGGSKSIKIPSNTTASYNNAQWNKFNLVELNAK